MAIYNNQTVNSDEIAYKILVNNSGNVFVTGVSRRNNTFDYATIKYSQPVGINIINKRVPDKFQLFQNYPNPFNPVTRIKFDIPPVGDRDAYHLLLKIYDILGRVAATLVNCLLKPGTYEIDFDGSKLTSGIYFYQLSANGQIIDTRKMVIIK